MKLWTPLRSVAGVLVGLLAGAAMAQTNALTDAELQGLQLAQRLVESSPAVGFTNSGVLNIRDAQGRRSEIPITIETQVMPANWSTTYEVTPAEITTNGCVPVKLVVVHEGSKPNQYRLTFYCNGDRQHSFTKDRSDIVASLRFAGDFSVADLGLEFLHWPVQKVLPKLTPLVRGREYTLLESTDPAPLPGGYGRVRSWIDKETGGILQAEAYNARGKWLKEFEPKSFARVNGQWELQEMEIRNVQTGSRTRLKFDGKN